MLDVLIVGAGVMGQRRALAASAHPEFNLSGVYDVDTARAAKLAEQLGCFAFTTLDGLMYAAHVESLVVVATPNSSHVSLTSRALASAHVLCEKPLAFTAVDARTLANLAHRRGRLLRTGFHIRQYRAVQCLQWALTHGAVGTPTELDITYGSLRPPGFETTWRVDTNVAGGGVLVDQGTHAFDLVSFLLGAPFVPEDVTLASKQFSVDDSAVLVGSCGNVQVKITLSWVELDSVFRVNAYGADGRSASVQGLSGRYGPATFTLNGTTRTLRRAFPGDDVWYRELSDIAAQLRGGRFVGGPGIDASISLESVRRAT